MVTGVPGQEGPEGNVAERKKRRSKEAKLGNLLKYKACLTRRSRFEVPTLNEDVEYPGNNVKEVTTNFGKLDKFEGHDFRRWQKKMYFILTTLKVVYILTTPMPELLEDDTVEAIRRRAKWENNDYIYRGHILNGMSGTLLDIYQNVEVAKELWDSLESKYIAEDASSKKFLVNKLPPSWKDFKHSLKHGKDDLSLIQLGSHLRIEESLRAQESDKGKGKEVVGPSMNMTEEGGDVLSYRLYFMIIKF
ncbi:hypothetical protein Tco_0692624 [Tanacetum coccineum]